MREKRRRLVSFAVGGSVLVAWGWAFAPSIGPIVGSRLAANTGGAVSGPSNCTPLQKTSTYYEDVNGNRQSTESSDSAQVDVYNTPGFSSQLTVTSPPASWKPATATDDQLARFGFPPRPSDPNGQAQWNATYANYHSSTPATPCLWSGVSNTYEGTSNSTGWAGAVGVHQYVYATEVDYQQPSIGAYDACSPYASGVAFWTGIGGAYGTALAQVGGSADINGDYVYPFAEFINTSFSGPTYSNNYVMYAGDTERLYIHYSSSNGGTFSFSVYDASQGLYLMNSSLSNAAQYYNDAWADFITEQTFTNTKETGQYLLRPYGQNLFSSAEEWTTQHGGFYFDPSATDMYGQQTIDQRGYESQYLHAVPSNGSLTTVWKSCG